MKRLIWIAGLLAGAALAGYVVVLPQLGKDDLPPFDPALRGDATRGAYVAIAAGCYACHTDTKNKGKPYAGGRAFKTPFGTIYSPNITSDPETGIGTWSVTDFRRALRAGVRPDGTHYYPAFPYTSYTHMTDQDVADLKAYFAGVAPVAKPNHPHDMVWPFSDRTFIGGWKWLYAPRQEWSEVADTTGTISRGAYMIEVLGHCGECHTQRNALGGYAGKPLAGNTAGPDGGKVPGLRNLRGKWSAEDLVIYLSDGMTPEGDFVGGEMAHVIDHSTSKLTQGDRQAIVDHLLNIR